LKDNVQITAVFDASPTKIGTKINSLTVQPIETLRQTILDQNIRIGIITVPASEAQNVANELVASGIEGILNFAPAILKVPEDVRIHHANFTTELLSLAYYIEKERLERDD
jgi:redox-sensing transcriptional repressor